MHHSVLNVRSAGTKNLNYKGKDDDDVNKAIEDLTGSSEGDVMSGGDCKNCKKFQWDIRDSKVK